MTQDDPTQPGSLREEPMTRRSGFSLIWVIPVLAVAAAVGVAVRNWSERGPLIEVIFNQAEGVRPGETELRYRDIPVGVVETVEFSETLDQVVAGIRLDQTIAPYVDADALFWIVRPQVTAQGVSGLDTVLSGVYIAGAWDGEPSAAEARFIGAETAPLLALGERGTVFTLRSDTSLPTANTPILYRGVQVGRMGEAEVDEQGLSVRAEAVILEPYDQLVSSSTRFWDTSGFSFSLNASGASLDFSSLASLISGGVTFETLASGGTPLEKDAVFTLHPDEATAREDFFLEGEGGSVDLMMIFDENLAGLQAGADVSLGGLKLGEVQTISGVVDADRFGDDEVRLVATARINPGRLGLAQDDEGASFLSFLERRVQEGLRARLVTASLLTGGLKVEFVNLPDATTAALDRQADPYPMLPTAPAEVTDVAASAQGLLSRVDNLPVEELMAELIGLLEDARGVIGSEDVQAAPADLRATLQAVRQLVESEEIAALPGQVGQLAEGLNDASAKLNGLLTQVEDQQVVAAVSDLIAAFEDTAQALPPLVDRAGAVLDKAEALPLQQIAEQVSALLGNADALVANEDLAALPGDLRTTLDSLRTIVESEDVAALPGQVGQLAEGLQEAADRVNTLLEQAQQDQIMASVSRLVASLDGTAQRLPGLADQASAVLSDAENLALDDLAAQARDLLASIDQLVDQDSTRALPDSLNGALTELRNTLEDLQEGGVVDNANATLASARQAAEAIAEASRSLPGLADRLARVADQAGSTIAGYNTDGTFGRELSQAIRQIEAAAQSFDRLARQIQRNPNSLITGR